MILTFLISTIAVLLAAYLLPGIYVDGFLWAFMVAVVMGLINLVVRPVVDFLSLPANILTLGLFTFVIDALMVMLAGWVLKPHFIVSGFWWALLFSIVLGLLVSLLNVLFHKK